MTNRWFALSLMVFMLWMAACQGIKPAVETNQNPQPLQVEIEVKEDLATLVDEALITQADAIFLGRVEAVGQTISGGAEGRRPYHQVAVTVLQPVIDEIALGNGGVLMINGRSPLDETATSTAAMAPVGHNLQVGDERVFIIQEAEFVQDGQTFTVLTPFTPFAHSILGAEKLEGLRAQAAQKRPLSIQPQSQAGFGAY